MCSAPDRLSAGGRSGSGARGPSLSATASAGLASGPPAVVPHRSATCPRPSWPSAPGTPAMRPRSAGLPRPGPSPSRGTASTASSRGRSLSRSLRVQPSWCLSVCLSGCLSSLGAQPTFVFVPSIRRSRLSRLLPPSERAHPALSCPSSSSPFRVPPGSPDLPAATWPSGCHRRSLIPSWLKAKLLPKRPIVLADAASSAPDPPCPRPPLVLARLRSALEPSSGR